MMSTFQQLLILTVAVGTALAQFNPGPPGSADHCSPNPCQNGGICLNIYVTYMCFCTPDFSGDHCEQTDSGEEAEFCSSNPCQNGGRCVEEDGLCYCASGYRGMYCEIPVQDICTSNPCLNGGTCLDLNTGSFLCLCPADYTGATCQSPYIPNVCENYNCNGGQCYSGVTGSGETVARCRCRMGYSGLHCEVTDSCTSNPCQNGGSCVPVHAHMSDDFYCQCTLSFTGALCESEVNDPLCVSNPCLNGGTCYVGRCICPENYIGRICEISIDVTGPCRDHPCLNGGTCHAVTHDDDDDENKDPDSDDDYACVCSDGYTGPNCGEAIKACDNQPCQNGGFCHDIGSQDYLCTCASGWEGPTCANVARSKDGSCPSPGSPVDCSSDNCQNDLDCPGLKKCCPNACMARECMEPDLSESSLCQRARAAARAVLANPWQYGYWTPINVFVPQCTGDGDFETIQCQTSGQECWCVNHAGVEIPGTSTHSGNHPFCPDISDNCPTIDCDEQCEFGFAVDSNGCTQCECYEPCKEFVCPSHSVCVPIKADCRHEASQSVCQGIPECIDQCFLGWTSFIEDDDDCGTDAGRPLFYEKFFFEPYLMECLPRHVCQQQGSGLFDSELQCQKTCREKLMKNVSAPLGYPLTLNCSAPSLYDETQSVHWQKNDRFLVGSDRPYYQNPFPGFGGSTTWQYAHYTLVNGTNLRIDRVTYDDPGQYTCNIRGAIPISLKFNLIVYAANCSQEIFRCPEDMCEHSTCGGHPEAICVPDNCGGCNVTFLDANGNRVTCEDETSICRVGNPLVNAETGEQERCNADSSCPGGYICMRSSDRVGVTACCPNPRCKEPQCESRCDSDGPMIDANNCPTCICKSTVLQFVQEKCLLPAETGTRCQNTDAQYWYDYQTATCSPYRCLGNENRFRSEEACLEQCLAPTQSEMVWTGYSITLECPFKLGDAGSLVWYKGPEVIAKGDVVISFPAQRGKYEAQEWKLTVNDAKMEDEATYTCEAKYRGSNNYFTVKQRFLLEVLVFNGEKPGTCPPARSPGTDFNLCVPECYSDSQCSGSRKCCNDGCAMICQDPVQGCPADKPPRWCSPDLCDDAICRWNHFAICKIEQCGGCETKFYNSDGSETNCDTPLSKCQLENLAARNADSSFVPTCFVNGSYTPVQCNTRRSFCWCVDETGTEIPDSRQENADVSCDYVNIVGIDVSFALEGDFSKIENQQEEFKEALLASFVEDFKIKREQVKNLQLSAGSIMVEFTLVNVKDANFDAASIASVMEETMKSGDYKLEFDGQTFEVKDDTTEFDTVRPERRRGPDGHSKAIPITIVCVIAIVAALCLTVVLLILYKRKKRAIPGETNYAVNDMEAFSNPVYDHVNEELKTASD